MEHTEHEDSDAAPASLDQVPAGHSTQLLVVPDEEGELGPVTGLRQPACEFWERLFAGGAVEEEEVYP